jgi:RNA polymerase sigma-70 factor, ECF subfamily
MFRSASVACPFDLQVLADEDLMALVDDGEMRAFDAICDRHAAVAWSLAYRVCGRRAMAEDVVQEAFLSLWHGRDRYDRARGSVRSWLLCVVHNRAIDALRRTLVSDSRRARDETIVGRIAAPELIETEVVRRDEARQVREALEQLSPEQRRVIELAYFGGLTHRQIAQVLKLPPGTVKGRIRLGLQKLRTVLERSALPHQPLLTDVHDDLSPLRSPTAVSSARATPISKTPATRRAA